MSDKQLAEDVQGIKSWLSRGEDMDSIRRLMKLSKRRFEAAARRIRKTGWDRSTVWGKFCASQRERIRKLDETRLFAMTGVRKVRGTDGEIHEQKVGKINLALAAKCIAQQAKIEREIILTGQGLGIYPDVRVDDGEQSGNDLIEWIDAQVETAAERDDDFFERQAEEDERHPDTVEEDAWAGGTTTRGTRTG